MQSGCECSFSIPYHRHHADHVRHTLFSSLLFVWAEDDVRGTIVFVGDSVCLQHSALMKYHEFMDPKSVKLISKIKSLLSVLLPPYFSN